MSQGRRSGRLVPMDAEVTEDPLVVTLALDPASQARFDAERLELFPPGRTQVGAHVTLFHALPGDLELTTAVRDALRPPFDVRVTGVLFSGRGVAYRLESQPLHSVHATLRTSWLPHLTAQDRQPFRPHVTVQNKVAPEHARATMAELASSFQPYDVHALGLDVWVYRGGPWVHREHCAFS